MLLHRGRGPGEWWESGDSTATVYCGVCGKPLSLIRHTIAPDGTVSPSIMTDADGEHSAVPRHEQCHYHVIGKLVGWVAP